MTFILKIVQHLYRQRYLLLSWYYYLVLYLLLKLCTETTIPIPVFLFQIDLQISWWYLLFSKSKSLTENSLKYIRVISHRLFAKYILYFYITSFISFVLLLFFLKPKKIYLKYNLLCYGKFEEKKYLNSLRLFNTQRHFPHRLSLLIYQK